MSPSVGLVVPAFRPDVTALHSYVEELDATLDPDAIRIELDDPQDGVVSSLDEIPATVNAVDARRGKGAAITAGFESLDTDVLAFADADGSTPATSVGAVVDPVVDGATHLTTGSRRHPAARVEAHQSVLRRTLGDGFAWLARRLLSVSLTDYQCGAKAIHREAWRSVRHHLHEPGFGWDVELVALVDALDYRVEEVPITWVDDPKSTVSPVGGAVELGSALLGARYRAKALSGHRIPGPIERRTTRSVSLLDQLAAEQYDE